MMSNAAKNFDILVWILYIIIFIMQYVTLFSDLYSAKFWDTSAKSFFLCNLIQRIPRKEFDAHFRAEIKLTFILTTILIGGEVRNCGGSPMANKSSRRGGDECTWLAACRALSKSADITHMHIFCMNKIRLVNLFYNS